MGLITRPTPDDHRAWEYALDRACPRHGCAPGEPCWSGPVVGLCSARTQTPAAPATSRPAPRARRGTKEEQ